MIFVPWKYPAVWFMAGTLLFPVQPGCAQGNRTESENLDLSGFQDGAHHWYDIAEEDRLIVPLPGQRRYERGDIAGIADNILLFQNSNGGWPKNYDMRAVLTDEQKARVRAGFDERNTTFDNGATHAQVKYLAGAYRITGDIRYRDACLRGIDFILDAQYPNGGWPQFYPDTSGYRKYITFNDGAMIGVMSLLLGMVDGSADFAFVDSLRLGRIRAALGAGMKCILACQIRRDGRRTVWCQQHDNSDLQPRGARTFEPAAFAGGESADIVHFLMRVADPDSTAIDAVTGAVEWYNRSAISGIRIETVEAPTMRYLYHTTSTDRIVVKDSTSPQIWARFYDLQSNRPVFCNRDGEMVSSLAEVERERRTGYSWYTYEPAEVLKQFESWRARLSASAPPGRGASPGNR